MNRPAWAQARLPFRAFVVFPDGSEQELIVVRWIDTIREGIRWRRWCIYGPTEQPVPTPFAIRVDPLPDDPDTVDLHPVTHRDPGGTRRFTAPTPVLYTVN